MVLMAGICILQRTQAKGKAQEQINNKQHQPCLVTMAALIRRAVVGVVLAFLSLPVLQTVLGALPLHWIYEPLEPVGPNSIYVPGTTY